MNVTELPTGGVRTHFPRLWKIADTGPAPHGIGGDTKAFGDLADGTGWGRVIEVKNPDGDAMTMAVLDRDLFYGWSRMLGELIDRGLSVTSKPWGPTALKTLLTKWEPTLRKKTAEHLGWTNAGHTAFVLGGGQVIGSGDVVLMGDIVPDVAAEIREQGTLSEWRRRIGEPCIGNPILTLAVSQAFTGPLLDYLGLDLGGGLHLRGASSQGKSTAAMAANSVWGSRRLMSTWRATANGLEGIAATHNGLLLVLDEIGEIDPPQLDKAIYFLANGVGKIRRGNFGSTEPTQRWRTSLLSTGEVSVDERLRTRGGRSTAGQEVRLVDVAADGRRYGAFDHLHGAADGAAFANQLKAATDEVFGLAGPEFVRKLIGYGNLGVTKVRAIFEGYLRLLKNAVDHPLDGQSARVAERFALIATAGGIATVANLTGWPNSWAFEVAKDTFLTWLDQHDDQDDEDVETAADRIRDFVVMHGDSIQDLSDLSITPSSIAKAWKQGDALFVPAGSWQAIFPGDDAARTARRLHEAGALHGGDGKNLMKKAPRRIVPRTRVYVLSLRRLEIGSEENNPPQSNLGTEPMKKSS